MNFSLPPEITFKKNFIDGCWTYNFRHNTIGELGRIILQKSPNGQCQVSCEVVGDSKDPLTKKRSDIFEPLGREIAESLASITGKSNDIFSPIKSPQTSPEIIESKLIPCDNCGKMIVMLIFAYGAIKLDELEDYSQKMYSKYSELGVDTWVIGDFIESEGFDMPTNILKVWPHREPIQQITPNDFDDMLDDFLDSHCKIDSIEGVSKPLAPGDCLRILNKSLKTDIILKLHEVINQEKNKDYDSPLVMIIASLKKTLSFFKNFNDYEILERNPLRNDHEYDFESWRANNYKSTSDFESKFKYDIKVFKFQLQCLKETLKGLEDFF